MPKPAAQMVHVVKKKKLGLFGSKVLVSVSADCFDPPHKGDLKESETSTSPTPESCTDKVFCDSALQTSLNDCAGLESLCRANNVTLAQYFA